MKFAENNLAELCHKVGRKMRMLFILRAVIMEKKKKVKPKNT